MALPPDEKPRRLIPRWRSLESSILSAEVSANPLDKRYEPIGQDLLKEKVEAWLDDPRIETAADALMSGVTIDDYPKLFGPAEFLLKEGVAATPLVKQIAAEMRGKRIPLTLTATENTTTAKIHSAKGRLKEYPRNSILWVELSLLYASVGQLQKSTSAMERALVLAPDHRFILRSATRLFVHENDPEKAQRLLRRSEATRHDPWLISAEISVSEIAGRKSRYIKEARDLVLTYEDHPEHITELAGALGTTFVDDGSIRQARRLFAKSLRDPTENAVAQAAWMARVTPGVIKVEDRLLLKPRGYEARVFAAYGRRDWTRVVSEAEKWGSDEPFSARPPMLRSYVASVLLRDEHAACRAAEAGLAANPHDIFLRNNLAVACARTGQVRRAEDILETLPRRHPETFGQCTIQATRGLVAYRNSDRINGRMYYKTAIELAEEKNLARHKVLLMLHQIQEELVLRPIDEFFLIERIRDLRIDEKVLGAHPDVVDALALLSDDLVRVSREPGLFLDSQSLAPVIVAFRTTMDELVEKLRLKADKRLGR